jgi:hypothetical protein
MVHLQTVQVWVCAALALVATSAVHATVEPGVRLDFRDGGMHRATRDREAPPTPTQFLSSREASLWTNAASWSNGVPRGGMDAHLSAPQPCGTGGDAVFFCDQPYSVVVSAAGVGGKGGHPVGSIILKVMYDQS